MANLRMVEKRFVGGGDQLEDMTRHSGSVGKWRSFSVMVAVMVEVVEVSMKERGSQVVAA